MTSKARSPPFVNAARRAFAHAGYRAQPSLMTVLVYIGYWLGVWALMRWRSAVQARRAAGASPSATAAMAAKP